MRTPDEVEAIKRHITAPYSIDNFLSQEEVTYLLGLFDAGQKLTKNTGPVTVDMDRQDTVVQAVLERLVPHLGPFEVTAAFFFRTTTPHIVHNDDTYELPPTVGKAVTIPLHLEGYAGGPLPKLCFFEQFYFHGPAKFFGGDHDVPTYYNQQVYEYSKVDGVTDKPFKGHNLVPHLKSSWLNGLSLHSFLDWRPTSALVFDSVRLHCASDFRTVGVTSKVALSIFTKRQCV
jgi:hypothetical protein